MSRTSSFLNVTTANPATMRGEEGSVPANCETHEGLFDNLPAITGPTTGDSDPTVMQELPGFLLPPPIPADALSAHALAALDAVSDAPRPLPVVRHLRAVPPPPPPAALRPRAATPVPAAPAPAPMAHPDPVVAAFKARQTAERPIPTPEEVAAAMAAQTDPRSLSGLLRLPGRNPTPIKPFAAITATITEADVTPPTVKLIADDEAVFQAAIKAAAQAGNKARRGPSTMRVLAISLAIFGIALAVGALIGGLM